jgi:O-antigen ligase
MLLMVSDIPLPKRSGLNHSRSLVRERGPAATRVALPLATTSAVAVPAAAHGAYFPTAWGWSAFAFAWVAVLTLALGGRVRFGRLEWITLAALGLLTCWIGLSALWSEDVSQTGLEVQRALVYLTAALAALLVLRSATVTSFLAALLAAVAGICTYSLATRLFPERLAEFDEFAINRLQQPLGYWNSLGTFAAIGVLLAIGFAARAHVLWGRALGGAALPVVMTTLYFTFGRGAWLALGAGLAAAVAVDRRRLQLVSALIVLAPLSAAAIWLCSRSEALTSRAPALADAASEGRRLAPILAAIALGSGAAAVAFALAERRVPPMPRARAAYAGALLAVAVAGTIAIFAAYGAPWTLAERGYREFVERPAPAPAGAPAENRRDLNTRLFSLWGNGRAELWAVAWDTARDEPLLGAGAGTYEQHWLRERPFELDARDAHSLYMEMLAELGAPGLALVIVALGVPLVAAVRARRWRLGGVTTGAYVVYVVHAGADWDWEMTAVTLTALFCGVALLVAARDESAPPRVGRSLRAIVVVAALAAAALSVLGFVGNRASVESERAAGTRDWGLAESEARTAIRWAPWSAQGWQALGEAELQQADFTAARRSFRRALAKDPEDWNLWLNLAYASTGAEQRRAADRALALNPLSSEIERVRPAIGLPPADG